MISSKGRCKMCLETQCIYLPLYRIDWLNVKKSINSLTRYYNPHENIWKNTTLGAEFINPGEIVTTYCRAKVGMTGMNMNVQSRSTEAEQKWWPQHGRGVRNRGRSNVAKKSRTHEDAERTRSQMQKCSVKVVKPCAINFGRCHTTLDLK